MGYYLQSVNGHLSMMAAAKPVNDWLTDETTPAALKTRLELSQAMRQFGITQLHLPDNASYTRYADLKRSAVVWNVVAAPALSLTLKTWCFPVAGCVGYRGYFDEQAARSLAQSLQEQGLETSVYGVPAYSTLGWLNWAGGDPLLSTFIRYPEGELARLLFHEMAHQVVYAKDDTAFNEAFATAVERIGADLWLQGQNALAAKAEDDRARKRRLQFRAFTYSTRQHLLKIYEQVSSATPSAQELAGKVAAKQQVMADFRTQYQAIREQWRIDSGLPEEQFRRLVGGYDQWIARANNASLGAQGAYDDWVPAFEALFQQHKTRLMPSQPQQVWPSFYDEVRRLAALPADQRHAQLRQLVP